MCCFRLVFEVIVLSSKMFSVQGQIWFLGVRVLSSKMFGVQGQIWFLVVGAGRTEIVAKFGICFEMGIYIID